MKTPSRPGPLVLLYTPNLICYARLALILLTVPLTEHRPGLCVILYLIFAISDGIDGWAARKLNQCSSFGAWLDVVVDNFGRTIIWANFQWGFLISNLEWIVFLCNHRHGSGWKEKVWSESFASAPFFVSKVMEKGFKTPLGTLAMCGLHGLPIWLFSWHHLVFENNLYFLPSYIPFTGFLILSSGRSLCIAVESWCVWTHIKCLLHDNGKQE